MVDRSELYPGAVVTARVRIIELNGDKVAFCVAIGREAGAYIRVATTDILSVEDRPLAVGDRVRVSGCISPARIVAIDGDLAWTRREGGGINGIFRLSDLTRLPEEPAPAEKAMRFKVGDRVDAGLIGRGTITAATPPPYKYEVRFDDGCIAVCPESDLSPAPAEDAP